LVKNDGQSKPERGVKAGKSDCDWAKINKWNKRWLEFVIRVQKGPFP